MLDSTMLSVFQHKSASYTNNLNELGDFQSKVAETQSSQNFTKK